MPTNKLTIVSVKIDPLPALTASNHSIQYTTEPSCVIKTAVAEISFFNGVDERIIQTIMKELKELWNGILRIEALTEQVRQLSKVLYGANPPANLACDCCLGEMVEFSSAMVREEAKFIPATLKHVQHFEHAYECKAHMCKIAS